MPYEIETQDGIVLTGIPDTVRPDDPNLKARVHQIRAERGGETGPDPAGGFWQNVAAGAGKAVVDTGRGIRQLVSNVGLGDKQVIQREIDESRQRDRALMSTGGGLTGNIGTQIGMALLPAGAMARAGGAVGAAGNAMLSAPATIGGALTQGALGAAQAGLQPVATGESRGANMIAGGIAGAAVPVAGMAMKGTKALVEPLYEGGRNQIIGRAMRSAAGIGADDAMRNMSAARELVPGSAPTAAQVANNGGIAALERTARAIDPTAYAARDLDQNAARVAALRGVAGDEASMNVAMSARDRATAALRQSALANADYGTTKTADLTGRISNKNDAVISALRDKGRFATQESQQLALAQNFAPVEGMPRVAGRYSHNIERAAEAGSAASDAALVEVQRKAEKDFLEKQLSSLQQAGYSPLQANGLTRQIDAVLSKPGLRASDVVQNTLTDIKTKLASLSDRAGNVSAQDLYTLRKEIGNTISTHAKASNNWDKRLTAGLERDLQGSIDQAIEKAGAGDLWKQYLSTYQELSKPINQMQVGQHLLNKLQPALSDFGLDTSQRAATYAQALRDAPGTIKGATGFGGDDLSKIMTPQQITTISNVGGDLARKVKAEQLGRGVGSDTVQKLAMTNILEQAGLPRFIGNLPGVRVASRMAYEGPDELMKQRLAQVLMSPQETAKVMQNATPSERQRLLSQILRSGGTPALIGGTAGAINAQ